MQFPAQNQRLSTVFPVRFVVASQGAARIGAGNTWAGGGDFARLQGAPVFSVARMPQPAPASLSFEDILIDFSGRRLLRGGCERPLEPKAFAVLALLAGSPGRVFGRYEILDAVWGHRHVTPGVLNRIMSLLRRALGENAQHPRLLHTVHRTGYRFDLPTIAGPMTRGTARTAGGTVIRE